MKRFNKINGTVYRYRPTVSIREVPSMSRSLFDRVCGRAAAVRARSSINRPARPIVARIANDLTVGA